LAQLAELRCEYKQRNLLFADSLEPGAFDLIIGLMMIALEIQQLCELYATLRMTCLVNVLSE